MPEITVSNVITAPLAWHPSQRSAVDAAIDGITSITDDAEKTALKAALGPVFDLPADLDAVVGKWVAVKAKFPKPE
tara:strand:+ start:121 stop:348 length:228 start_codon:yes stop_codon:yes gene_type:complete